MVSARNDLAYKGETADIVGQHFDNIRIKVILSHIIV